jgi:hypothetical protein
MKNAIEGSRGPAAPWITEVEKLPGIMHQVACYASKPHFVVGFCPEKLLEQP